MRLTGHHNPRQTYTAVFGMAAGALAFLLMLTASLRLADALLPQNGDIINFTPGSGGSLTSSAVLVAKRAGHLPDAYCMLDPRVMLRSGGSLVIEATEPSGTRRYRVHWAGGRTSNAGRDCGRSADLLLTPDDISVLFLVGSPLGATFNYDKPGVDRGAR